MKTSIYSLALSLLFLGACTANNEQTPTTTTSDSAGITTAVPVEKAVPTTVLLTSYLKLKNALVADQAKDAAAAGNEMITAFASFDKAALTAEQSKTYTEIHDSAKEHAEHIEANATNIVHQREHFDMLSKDIYDLVKLLGTSQTLYVEHCPMYNNNKGASWLSTEKEIKNPYYGASMLTCGSVTEELK